MRVSIFNHVIGPGTRWPSSSTCAAALRIGCLVYETDEFHLRSFGATWLPDASGYLKLETPADGSGAEIARYDSASGEDGSDHWLYEPESVALRPVKAVRGARFDANAFSPNERRLLGSRGPDLIVYDMAGDPTYPKMNIHYGYTSS